MHTESGGLRGGAPSEETASVPPELLWLAIGLAEGTAAGGAYQDLQSPHLELDIPRRILQEYRELILNKRSIKATRGLWSYGWHIDRYGLRLAGPQYGLSIDTRSLSKADSEYSLDKRAVSAGFHELKKRRTRKTSVFLLVR